MREITRTKKIEVAQRYLLGYTYGDIESQTGVSQGGALGEIGSDYSQANMSTTKELNKKFFEIPKLGGNVKITP